MKNCAKKICIFVFLLLAGNFIFAQNFPSLKPLFNVSPYHKDLSGEEMIKLGLEFSECSVESEKGKKALEKFRQLEKKYSSAYFKNLNLEETAERILEILYQEVLFQYEEGQTRLDVTFETGTYNCVSASVLYMAFSKHAGLKHLRAQKTPTHAFLMLQYEKDSGEVVKIDIETTNPYGFNPGTKKVMEESEESTRYYFVPKKNYANRQYISENGLIALIAGNLCSYYISKNDFKKAVPVATAAYLLLKDDNTSGDDTRHNLDVVCSNYIADFGVSSELEGAGPWLKSFVDRYGMSDYMQKTFNTLVYNVVINSTNNNQPGKARFALDTYKNYITQKQYLELDEVIFETELNDYYLHEESEMFIQYCINLKQQHPEYSEERLKVINILQENGWISILNEYGNNQQFLMGWYKSGEALKQLPGSTKLKKMNNSFKTNAGIIFHNQFVDLVNGGFHQDALDLLEEALEIFPDNKTLAEDMRVLKKYMNR